ncbi:exosortase-associated protein EpsI, V-type [Sphingomonas qilianensis]
MAPTTAIGRREMLIGGALLATAGIAFVRLPRLPVIAVGGSIKDVLPTTVGAWQSFVDPDLVMPPNDERAAAAVYEEQISRTYRADNENPIMMLIAYARRQSGMLMVHRPESCYPGSGFTITADRAVQIPLARGVTLGGRFLSTARDERIEQVLYWTRLGNGFPIDWDEERSNLAKQNLQGLQPDGALIRLSMISPDPATALASLTRFASALFHGSGRDGRALLAGPANV